MRSRESNDMVSTKYSGQKQPKRENVVRHLTGPDMETRS